MEETDRVKKEIKTMVKPCSQCLGDGESSDSFYRYHCEECDGIGYFADIDKILAIKGLAVLTPKQVELLDKTRLPCSECDGKGYDYKLPEDDPEEVNLQRVPCPTCQGTGKGEVDWDRLAVLDDDQSLPKTNDSEDRMRSRLTIPSATVVVQQDMKDNNWKKMV